MISIHTYIMMICFFFFNDTATTEIYTLSLHDALPISVQQPSQSQGQHAVESMDTDFLIGPMIERLPTHEVGILHGAEGSLHMMLTAVRQNDLLGRPLVVVGEQNSSSQGGGDELLQGQI